jgi:hypothetical protein
MGRLARLLLKPPKGTRRPRRPLSRCRNRALNVQPIRVGSGLRLRRAAPHPPASGPHDRSIVEHRPPCIRKGEHRATLRGECMVAPRDRCKRFSLAHEPEEGSDRRVRRDDPTRHVGPSGFALTPSVKVPRHPTAGKHDRDGARRNVRRVAPISIRRSPLRRARTRVEPLNPIKVRNRTLNLDCPRGSTRATFGRKRETERACPPLPMPGKRPGVQNPRAKGERYDVSLSTHT